ncbi:SGNH/GDSL hydrolase family protein [Ramlibacter pinisoli]|nr:SGNH/GDSL hydrolase family protein [Ramlibacter pinisoli]
MVASFLLGACGGGGGGGGDTAAPTSAPAAASPAPAPASALAAPTTPNIALWGDSLTPPVFRALAPLSPNRQVFDGGVPGETSMQIAARQAQDPHADWITVFWYGHNNIRIDTAAAPEQIKQDLAASIARLTPGNNRFLVLSVVNNAVDGARGSVQYNTIIQLNQELARLYPGNFFDMRAFMVAQGDPQVPQQAAELQADVPSSRLRFDEIHLTGAGADVVARRLQQEIAARGW